MFVVATNGDFPSRPAEPLIPEPKFEKKNVQMT